MATPEMLEEGWVRFRRIPCKEGNIDIWHGDVIDNPNKEEKNNLNLNSIATYLRCNNSKWINVRDLRKREYLSYLYMNEEFTAEEIWKELYGDNKTNV